MYFSQQKSIEESSLKNLFNITARAYDIMTTQAELGKITYCDWLINPADLQKYNMFETKITRMNEIFAIGYKTAAESYELNKNILGIN